MAGYNAKVQKPTLQLNLIVEVVGNPITVRRYFYCPMWLLKMLCQVEEVSR
jgi:hypothetical protein